MGRRVLLAVATWAALVAHCLGQVSFTVLHINDMHARVEGIRGSGGCVQSQNDESECDGGWARMLTAGKLSNSCAFSYSSTFLTVPVMCSETVCC